MALKFVTAKAGAAHISSADWKSLNRGIMGRGKYILIDTENNSPGGYIVSPAQGEVSVPPCSLMWSGAHIRNTTTTVLKYTPPTVDSTINVWLHYMKNADSGVETLEFVLTVNEQPTPVIDEIEDNALEAYTLFCYFTHKVGSTEEEYYNRGFEPVASLVGTQERTDQRLEALDDKLDEEIEKRQSDIAAHTSRLNKVEGQAVANTRGIDVIAQNLNVAPNNLGVTIATSTKSLETYRMLVLVGENGTLAIPALGKQFTDIQILTDAVSLTAANKVIIVRHNIYVNPTTSGFSINHSISLTSSSEYYSQAAKINAIYGIR